MGERERERDREREREREIERERERACVSEGLTFNSGYLMRQEEVSWINTRWWVWLPRPFHRSHAPCPW